VQNDLKNIVSKTRTPGTKRIQRAKDKQDIIDALLSDDLGVFKEIWRVLLFAAQVGFKNRTRETLKSVDTSKGIDQGTFGNSPVWPGILYLMALVETESTDCLSGTIEAEDIRVSIFQEYANGGLSTLKSFFSDRSLNLTGFLVFIEQYQSESKERVVDLEITI
jgi:dnd system-associated protein 4